MVQFCHSSVQDKDHRDFWFWVSASLMSWSCAHTYSSAWETKCDAPWGCGNRNFPVSVSHPSFLRASFSLSSLWVLPPDISRQRFRVNKNTLLWFLTHFHHSRPFTEERGDPVQSVDITFHSRVKSYAPWARNRTSTCSRWSRGQHLEW